MLTQYQRDNYEGAGLILMTTDMSFLLVREVKSGKWGICKGHRERKDGGDPTNTAKREAYEELGLVDTDYDICGHPFVMQGSPKIYVFQCAYLKTDIMTKFRDTKFGLTTGNSKLREITEIKMVSYYDFLHDLNNYQNNVYVRLLQAHMSGTFVASTPMRRFSVEKTVTPFDSPKSDLERLSVNDEKLMTPPRKFYNSGVIGGSPIAIGLKRPEISPILAPETGELNLPPLQLKATEDLYSTGRSSPMKPRERTESGGSLLEALRGSPTHDRGPSPSMNLFTGGGAGGSISPRTCATSFVYPHSPSPALISGPSK